MEGRLHRRNPNLATLRLRQSTAESSTVSPTGESIRAQRQYASIPEGSHAGPVDCGGVSDCGDLSSRES